MHSQALTLGSHRRMAAWEVTETYRRDLVVWLQDEGWRDICHCPCVEPSPLWPNLNLHWPNEPHSLYPGDSLGLCCASPNLCTARGSFSGKQLALTPSEVILKKLSKIYRSPASGGCALREWLQTQHWLQIRICIYMVNTTYSTLVIP